jgi:hypothetical protein
MYDTVGAEFSKVAPDIMRQENTAITRISSD